MRPCIVTIFIAMTVVVTIVFCSRKFKQQPDELDDMERAIIGAKTLIPVDRTISLFLVPLKQENEVYVAYCLAPRNIYFSGIRTDTFLFVCDASKGDSMINDLKSNKRVFWENADKRYAYALICSK